MGSIAFYHHYYIRGESESWGLCHSLGVDPKSPEDYPAKFEPDSSIRRRYTAMQSRLSDDSDHINENVQISKLQLSQTPDPGSCCTPLNFPDPI